MNKARERGMTTDQATTRKPFEREERGRDGKGEKGGEGRGESERARARESGTARERERGGGIQS